MDSFLEQAFKTNASDKSPCQNTLLWRRLGVKPECSKLKIRTLFQDSDLTSLKWA